MTPTNREAQQWDQVRAQAAARKLAKERQEAVAAYVQSNTPEGASGCSQAVVSHEGRAVAARGSRTVSLTPHAADGAGLGLGQGRLF